MGIIKEVADGGEGIGAGTQLGTHLSVASLKAKFKRNRASYFANPKSILEEAGYGRQVNADGYDQEEQEAVDDL